MFYCCDFVAVGLHILGSACAGLLCAWVLGDACGLWCRCGCGLIKFCALIWWVWVCCTLLFSGLILGIVLRAFGVCFGFCFFSPLVTGYL